jgi:hypothetical protein
MDPFGSLTCGKMSDWASIPRAYPKTGIVVKWMIPFVLTDACVSFVFCAFHPLLALSAECREPGRHLLSGKIARIVEHFVPGRFFRTRRTIGPPD